MPGETWLTVLVSLCGGGIGIKLVERLLIPKEKVMDDATAIRSELRQERIGLLQRQDELQKKLEDKDQRYYTLMEESIRDKTTNERLTLEIEELSQEIADLQMRLEKAVADAQMWKERSEEARKSPYRPRN